MSSRELIDTTRLQHLGTILVGGPDAVSFLQGQLSADVGALTAEGLLVASCNSAPGRVQAVTWLIRRTDGVALVVPASMVEMTTARLRRYVLRSKVTIQPSPTHLTLALVRAPDVPVAIAEPAGHREHEGASYIRFPCHDAIVRASTETATRADEAIDVQWRLDDIRAGLPQVYPATYEAFVAQMLNLDLLGGISFQKGCYTGQEIIARAHYRGAVKRRMFRFAAQGAAPAPGTRVLVGSQHAGDVVDAVDTRSGSTGCELLAVVSLANADQQLTLEGSEAKLQRLQLPYEVAS